MFYVRSTSGVKIAVFDFNPQGQETVFLVHGWPLSHKIYEYQIELLTQRGYRVVAIDLRGFGQSDAPACGYSYDQMAEDIYNVVCHLGLKSFVLVGFSMGGAIALRYMNRFAGFGVCRLILLAAAAPCWTQHPGYPYGLSPEFVDGLVALAKTDRPQLCENFSRQLFASPQSQSAIDWFKLIALSGSGVGTLQTLLSLRDEDGSMDLACVHVPTRIVHGDKDVVVPRDLIMLQHKEICTSKLCTLKNSGHGVMYDQLELFNRCFIEAIER